jgi:GPH family glycoside/pentoside/hexuronide:cation symporter/probable glucitol transport protein GutA
MSAALTIDPVERNKVVMVPRTMSMVGFLVVNLATLPLVKVFNSWTIVAIIYAIIAVCFTMITFFNVKERIHVKRDKKQTINDVWLLFKANKPLRMALYSLFVLETMNYLRFSFAFYYLKYNFGKEHMIPIFSGLYLIVTVIGSILSPFVSKKIGKRKAAILGAFVYSISSIGMFFTGYISLIPLFVWASIGAFFFGINNIALNSMVVDCVEYGEYKTGNRAEGMVFSTNIFKTKLASAVGGSLGAYALAIIGYVANQDQSLSTLDAIHRLFTIYTGIFTVLSLIPLFYYELTEEVYKKVVGEMELLKKGRAND